MKIMTPPSKFITKVLATCLVSFALLAPVTAHAFSWFVKPGPAVQLPGVTNYVPVVVTNPVVQIVTNTVTGLPVTNTIYVPVTNYQQVVSVQWQTNFVVSPAVTNLVATGQQVTGLLPPPYGTIAGGILALLAAGAGLLAKAKSGQLSTAQSIVSAVVSGVEAAGDANTKSAIQVAASAAGVQADLHSIVQSQTESPHPGAVMSPEPAPVPKV